MIFIFPYIVNVIIPTDALIFFRGVGIPPTRYIYIYISHRLTVFLPAGLGTEDDEVLLPRLAAAG